MNSIIEAQEEFDYWKTQARIGELRKIMAYEQGRRSGKGFTLGRLLNRAFDFSNVDDHAKDAVGYLAQGLVISPEDVKKIALYKKGDIVLIGNKTYKCEG
jgi:hypothetical protein